MRPSESGKRVLPPSSQINCEPSDEGKEARSWYVDETYVNVKGTWCYLSCAIDRDGNLVDSIAVTPTSTIGWSKTTVASNSATTRCVGLEASPQPPRFCRAFDEVRQFFRVRTTMKQKVSLVHQRDLFRQRLDALKAMVAMA